MSAEKCQKQHLVAGGLGEDDHGEDEDERDARHDAADARSAPPGTRLWGRSNLVSSEPIISSAAYSFQPLLIGSPLHSSRQPTHDRNLQAAPSVSRLAAPSLDGMPSSGISL